MQVLLFAAVIAEFIFGWIIMGRLDDAMKKDHLERGSWIRTVQSCIGEVLRLK